MSMFDQAHAIFKIDDQGNATVPSSWRIYSVCKQIILSRAKAQVGTMPSPAGIAKTRTVVPYAAVCRNNKY